MRVVGHRRVSTDRETAEGFGLGIEEAAITWAEASGHETVSIKGEGIRGSSA